MTKPVNKMLNETALMTSEGHEIHVGTWISSWSTAHDTTTPMECGLNPEMVMLSGVGALTPEDAIELARLLLLAADRLEVNYDVVQCAAILTDTQGHESRDEQDLLVPDQHPDLQTDGRFRGITYKQKENN